MLVQHGINDDAVPVNRRKKQYLDRDWTSSRSTALLYPGILPVCGTSRATVIVSWAGARYRTSGTPDTKLGASLDWQMRVMRRQCLR